MATEDGSDYVRNLSYYYIGHFSRFIKSGAKHIASTRYTDKVEVTAFVNPDGERVVVLLNKTDEEVPVNLREGKESFETDLAPHSIRTVTYR